MESRRLQDFSLQGRRLTDQNRRTTLKYDIESVINIFDDHGEKLTITSDPDGLSLVMIKGNDYFGGEIQFGRDMLDAFILALQKFKKSNDY